MVASVPPASCGAWNSILPITSLAFMSVNDVARRSLPVLVVASADAPIILSWSADSSHSKYAPADAPNIFTSRPVSSTPTVTVPSIWTAPSISTASRLVVPSISALPDMSKVAASNSPVSVTFLNDPISLLESTTTPRLADTVPAVTASNTFNSAAVVVTAVPPISSLSFTISTTAPPAVSNLSAEVSHSM